MRWDMFSLGGEMKIGDRVYKACLEQKYYAEAENNVKMQGFCEMCRARSSECYPCPQLEQMILTIADMMAGEKAWMN